MQIPAPAILTPDMSLEEILTACELSDSGEVSLTPEQQTQLGEMLLKKVDGCRYRLDSWADDADRHRSYALEHTVAARAIEAKIERLKERIAYSMAAHDFPVIQGEQFSFRLQSTKSVEIDEVAARPDAALWQEFPEYIKQSFAWDKTAIKSALESGAVAFTFAKIKESKFIKPGLKR
jgi:hypothetical protein